MAEVAKRLPFGVIDVGGPRVRFPVFCACAKCGGLLSFWDSKTKTNESDTEKVREVSLVQYGYCLAKWEGKNMANSWSPPRMCDCECQHEWDVKTVEMCWHRYTCKKCGHSMMIDSSD